MSTPYPIAPKNVFVTTPYFNSGVLDIRWDSPTVIPGNSAYDILGVNVWRSFDSEFGPYELLNSVPVGTMIYRDMTETVHVQTEDVSGAFLIRGDDYCENWMFEVQNKPMVRETAIFQFKNFFADRREDVVVRIDGQEVPVMRVEGERGRVYLINKPYLDPVTERPLEPILPSESSTVTCSYHHHSNLVDLTAMRRVFYKVTTVGISMTASTPWEPSTPWECAPPPWSATPMDTSTTPWDPATPWDSLNPILEETPLDTVPAHNVYQMERVDWIWREAIRRNSWIRDQAGERVKVFIRKWHGLLCQQFSRTHKQAINDCEVCYGTGFVGGYEGPFDIIIAPPEAERTLELVPDGLKQDFTFSTWTGPSPLLGTRDVVLRQNNERFTVGGVNPQGQRGAYFQQHFNIRLIEERDDIRYRIEVPGGRNLPPTDEAATPPVTDKETIPDSQEERGRTVTFENITY